MAPTTIKLSAKKTASAATRKLTLKLLDATSSVHETLLTGERRMRIHGHVAKNNLIFYVIDNFRLLGLHSRLRKKLLATGNIDKTGRKRFRMYILFHMNENENPRSDYPWRALKRGFVLLITYRRPRRFTTLQSGCRFLRVLIDETTFITKGNIKLTDSEFVNEQTKLPIFCT